MVILGVLCLGVLGDTDPLLPRVMVNVSTTNVNAFTLALNVVSNRIDRGKYADRVVEVDGVCDTNGNTYSSTWYVTLTSSNAAWVLFTYVSTNQFNSVIRVNAHFHMCPCGPVTNPPSWGPCTDVSKSFFTSTNR
jgi:hypothetical protein